MDRETYARELNALQDLVAEKHVKRIALAIERAWLEVAEGLATTARADLPLAHIQTVKATLEGLYREITRRTATDLVGQFKRGFQWLETKADADDFYERIYEQYLYIYGASAISQISEATRRQIAGAVQRGLVEGLSLPEIAADMITRAPEIGAARAAVIARTETHSASMYSSLESARRSSVPLIKEWVSVEDHRTRDFGQADGIIDAFSHAAMNGVQVDIEELYDVPMRAGTTEGLMFPGDPTGSPGNVINCRCSQVYTTADDDGLDPGEEPTPVQREPGGAQFSYDTIADPKASTAALNAFITDNEIATRVDLKGISPAVLAPHMRQFLEVKERFGLDPMYAVGPASRFLARGGRTRGALAAIYRVTDRETGRQGIWHMPTAFGNEKEWDKNMRAGVQAVAGGRYATRRRAYFADSRLVESEVRLRAQRMDDDGRDYAWTVDSDGALPATTYNYRTSTVYHEFGHVFHLTNTAQPQVRGEIDDFLRRVQPIRGGWGRLVSEYGNSKDTEYVAETFAIYMRGDQSDFYRIHPELLAIYQRYDRATVGKSLQLWRAAMMRKEVDLPGAESLVDDGAALINAVVAAAEEDRDELARELLAAYIGDDKDLVEAWLEEAIALTVVDII
jgi:hypothetical protein